jgi:hypothetical protein
VAPEGLIRCFGCGASVPDVAGPTHRYMLSAPGCWQLSGELQGTRPRTQFTVDGDAVQHPGVPSPQANQSVCVHLMNLCRVLERGGDPAGAPPFLAGLTHRAYPWLEPPPPEYPITVVDLLAGTSSDREFAASAWEAWKPHHETIRGWLTNPSTLPAPSR